MSPQAPRPPAPKPTTDRRLARDVAKHLDRRQMRRKLLLWALLIGAIVLAALYLTCGRGFGLGGPGKGKGKGEGPGSGPGSVQTLVSPADTGPRECQVRVAADGITVDGKPATVDEAVAACKDAASARVFLTGGARQGDWEDLKAAFERAKIEIALVEPKTGGRDDGTGTKGGGAAGSAGSAGP